MRPMTRCPSVIRGPARWIAAAALALVSPIASGAPCAGFSDVGATSSFCPNIEWLKNRAITFGCTAAAYCPTDPVTRLSMAAFMNRLGTALTPVALRVDLTPGALDLDAVPVVCQTAAFDVTGYPRSAIVDVTASGRATSATTFAAVPVASADGGASWFALTTMPARMHVNAMQWSGVSHFAHVELAVDSSLKFGVRLDRGGVAGSIDLADSRCQLRVVIFSRDGSAPPL